MAEMRYADMPRDVSIDNFPSLNVSEVTLSLLISLEYILRVVSILYIYIYTYIIIAIFNIFSSPFKSALFEKPEEKKEEYCHTHL